MYKDTGICVSDEFATCIAALAWAAISKYHRLGVLNFRIIFCTVLRAGDFKIKMPADLVSTESPFSGLQTAAFSLCPHKAECEVGGGEESELCGPFSFLQGH